MVSQTVYYMGLPFDSEKSVTAFIKYNQNVEPDQRYKDEFGGSDLVNASADDLLRYGFNSEYTPSGFSLQLNSVLKTLSGSGALRLAGAALLALTGASILADNHQSEASSIQPLDADGSGYTPLFPHGEMVKHAHDSHFVDSADNNLTVSDPDLPQLNPAEFTTLSGGGFTATRIHGDGVLTDLSYLIVGQGYNDQQLLDSAQLYASTLLSIEPFKSIQDKISISVLHTQNTPDLGTSSINKAIDVLGDSAKVQKLIDLLNLNLGSFQETRILVNNTTAYAAAAFTDPKIPTLYSYAAFTEAKLRGPFYTRGTIAHEDGHATGGAGEGYYSTDASHGPNVFINCLTADQIPLRWRDIPGAPGAIYEGCGNVQTGAFHDAERDVMRNYSGIENPTYGPVTLWQLNHRLDGAPAIYYSPTLLEPADGITVNGLGVNLRFNPSEMARQF